MEARGKVLVRILAEVETLPIFQSTHTSQKEVATAPGIECTQGEAGEDHCCAQEGGGKDAVKGKDHYIKGYRYITYT